MARDVTASLGAGLALRPLPETARTTLQWLMNDPSAARPGGLDAAAEREVLREWHAWVR
jgi:2'-hydroxyisoflavone reductase